MWGIETYKETGEFHVLELTNEKWPKYETVFEPISEDLYVALEVFSKRYEDWERYSLNVVWRYNVKSFYVEEYPQDNNGNRYRHVVASLKRDD